MEQQQQQAPRKRRSLSRSPSLSRRSSLRGGDKSSLPSSSSGSITKSKSKRGLSVLGGGGGGGGGSGAGTGGGSKKERWLLTRKTWRYMTDAVGNLLPEYYSGGSSTGVGGGASKSGTSRRGSSSAGSGSSGGGFVPISSTSSSYYGGPATTASSGYTSYSLSSPPFRQSVPRSSICSSSGTVPLVEEEECFIVPRSSVSGGSSASKPDVPTLEKHFEQACTKEKKFLLWTRNKAKGLAGPALREAKLKDKEKQAAQAAQQQQSHGKSKSGGLLSRRRGDGDIMEDDGQMGLTRSQSSSSSLMTMGWSSSAGGGGMRSGRRATQDLLDYFSPGEEEGGGLGGGGEDDDELMDDADDYDEYDDEHDEQLQATVRRKSSTASSIVSLVSGGLSFFRHHHQQQQHQQQQLSSSSQPPTNKPSGQYSGALGTIFIRTIPSTGVQKYYRNSAVQTEPFPDEILVRLRLQFIHEEQHAQTHGGGSNRIPSSTGLQQTQQQLRHVMTLPIDKSASVGGFPHLQSRSSSSPTSATAAPNTTILTGSLSASTSPTGGTPTTLMQATSLDSAHPPPASAPPIDQTDKKSEESGYSSASISDTVMRYLRMARKSSKADNKEAIDKFKTVNYDRSLRYIKSKDVTVEEALEHEKNKALQAAQKQLGIVSPDPAKPELAAPATSTTSKVGGNELGDKTGSAAPPPSPSSAKTVELKSKSKVKKTKPSKKQEKEAGAAGKSSVVVPEVGDNPNTAPDTTNTVITHEDIEKARDRDARVRAGREGSDSNATSTPQTPLSPTSTSAPPSSIYSSSRSGSGSSSVPPMSPPPCILSSASGMMIQGCMTIGAATSSGSSSNVPGSALSATTSSVPAPSSLQLPTFPPPPILVAIGVQAGESLVHLLKNYNPSRKLSDLSMHGGSSGMVSDYSSILESMAAGGRTGPRYSVISTGTSTGTQLLSSNSDSELFSTAAGGHGHGHYFLSHQQEKLLVPLGATSMSSNPSSSSTTYRKYSTSNSGTTMFGTVDTSTGTTMEARHRPMTSSLKKSASSQPMLLRIDDSTTMIRSPSPSNISSTSSTGSGGNLPGSGHYGTSSYPSLATAAATSSSSPTTSSLHLLRHQHHSALGLYNTPSTNPNTFLSPTTKPSSSSSTSLGVELLAGSTGSRKKYSTLTWAETTSGPTSMSASLPIVSSPSSLSLGSTGGGGDGGRAGGSNTPVTSTTHSSTTRPFAPSTTSSPSNYSSLTSTASHFLSNFRSSRRKGSGGSTGGKSDGGGSGLSLGFLGHSSSGGDSKQKSGSSSFGSSNVSSEGQLLYSADPLVMQKSKSSSSVFHHHHGSGSSGAQSTSGGTSAAGASAAAEKRGSTASTTSIILPTTPMSTGSRLMSKTRLFKSRSKSQTRIGGSTSNATCTWTPQGKCKWTNLNGRQVTLQLTTVLHLNETERTTLQKVALAKLQALNLDVEVKIPREKIGGTLQKPKRRPYLLKKKALSTGFFESGSKEGANKELGSGSGLVFGISLTQCVTNDKKVQEQQHQLDQINQSSGRDWEQNIPPNATSTSTIRRSQNGSRNSVSSVFENTSLAGGGGAGKEEKQQMGSNESLYWARKHGSNAALDSLSSSSGDLLADQHIPSIDSSPIGSVPSIVSSCIKHLENYGLHTTGIFRVSTSLKRIRQLREEIDSGKVIEFGEEHSPHDIAALLKEFLRDLPEPLLCRDLYQAFLRTQKIRNRKLQLEAVQHLIQLLPVTNRDTLVSLLKFFAKVVDNSSDTRSKTGEILLGNKMEGYSLATLIAPNILPCMPTEGLTGSNVTMDPNSVVTKERRESIDVVNYMIANYRELFEVSPELLDEVYVHMMDTHPDVVENIFKQRTGQPDDLGFDELETTSSVFEGSESGEPADIDETISFSSTKKILQKREDILHKDGGKGGQSNARADKHEKSYHHHQKSHHSSKDTDLDKQQSGGESDSSSTKSASRWFRRAKHSSDHSSKLRTSSDSGSEQVGKGKKTHLDQHQQPHRQDSSLSYETKRANSLDSVSVTLKDSSLPNVITLTEQIFNPGQIDQKLQVPENINRRQSSPILDSSGVITASLKIPVPVPLLDDTDIPYIEDDNNEVIQQQLHHHYHHIHSHQPQVMSLGYGRSGSTDSTGHVRHSATTTSNTTPASSHAGSPFSSPMRQPSSEVSSPLLFSPPMSPDDQTAFPYEEMTARFCIGTPGNNSEATTTTSSSGSTSSSLLSGTTIVSKVPNPKSISSATKTVDNVPSTSMDDRTNTKSSSGYNISNLSPVKSTQSSITPSSSSTTTTATTSSEKSPASYLVTSSEIKLLGRETKGANIAGLIKSKTADFEKIAKESQTSAPSTPPSKIASSMRLRSQGNIQLKQQFLLRQHERQPQPLVSSTSSSVEKTGPSGSSPVDGRSLQRNKKFASSSSAIVGTTTPAVSSSQQQQSQSETSSQLKPSTISGSNIKPSLSATAVGGPSRWKRSEIIASRQTGSSSTSSPSNTMFTYGKY